MTGRIAAMQRREVVVRVGRPARQSGPAPIGRLAMALGEQYSPTDPNGRPASWAGAAGEAPAAGGHRQAAPLRVKPVGAEVLPVWPAW